MKSYEIYLVPNGRRDDFRRGMTGAGWPDACQLWGKFDTVEECRERFRELAEENFREYLGYDAISNAAERAATESGHFNDDQSLDIGGTAADRACAIYADNAVASDDPTDWGIEWKDDLQFVMVSIVED